MDYMMFPGQYLEVSGRQSLSERFDAIRRNYGRKRAMVEAGLDDWFCSDPYQLGNWPEVFTPIEYALWFEIRGRGLDLWPQLPVDRFFVDFGNPVAKVAIECDGKEWHKDSAKDQERDNKLERMGWMVLRIPGWQCNRRILDRHEAADAGIEDFEQWRDLKTPYTSLEMARERLEAGKQRARKSMATEA